MRILVCGGRDFADRDAMARALAPYKTTATMIIHGGARGADTLAREWADVFGIPSMAFPVSQDHWDRYGKAAGPMRNRRMIEYGQPQLVVALPGGRGTSDMISQAMKAGIPITQPLNSTAT